MPTKAAIETTDRKPLIKTRILASICGTSGFGAPEWLKRQTAAILGKSKASVLLISNGEAKSNG